MQSTLPKAVHQGILHLLGFPWRNSVKDFFPLSGLRKPNKGLILLSASMICRTKASIPYILGKVNQSFNDSSKLNRKARVTTVLGI